MKRMTNKFTEQGLTLVESLAAIMVITIIISAISPALLIAFATRVHNYRVSQAIRIAQGEIDRVRLLIERGEYDISNLPPSVGQAGAGNFELDDVVRAPTPNANPPACPLIAQGNTQVTAWCSQDINDDGQWDLAVQTFRSSTPADVYERAGDQPVAFLMGVRVYTRAALTETPSRLAAFPRRQTTSAGLTAGQSLSHPLITRYAPIVNSDGEQGRFNQCELIKAIENIPTNCGN